MFEIAIRSEIGTRDKMEDSYYFNDLKGDGLELFDGIYDGHGGKFAAEYAKKNLAKIFFREIKKGKKEKAAFVTAYEEISLNLKNQESGTTAVNFYLKDKKLTYANVGDARLIVIARSKAKQLSQDHRLDNPQKIARIMANGGIIMKPYVVKEGYGLMPTRTLGDEYFKEVGVIATPTVGQYQIRAYDQWILAASDGLFDFMDNEETSRFLTEFNDVYKAAEALKTEVLIKRKGSDNLTFILLRQLLKK